MITYARLQHFRSYLDGSFEFDPSVNIIVGPNASGKTTLLEAVILALNGKSFKARDYELLQTDAEWARVDIGMADTTRVVKIQRDSDKTVKTFDIGDREFKRLLVHHTLPTVLFEPNHLLLLHGSPELRRNFLDDLICQISPSFSAVRSQYKRVLAQRNALLKQQVQPKSDQLFVWNLRLSELGGKIASERLTIIERFNTVISQLYSEIASEKTTIELKYSNPTSAKQYETKLLHLLEKSIARDTALGFTSHGPHREDTHVYINERNASETASRGEIRTLLLALKMLEAQFIEDARGTRPLLLLDDVFSELDGKRRQALVDFLKPYQSLITTTDADVVIEHFTESAHVIPVNT